MRIAAALGLLLLGMAGAAPFSVEGLFSRGLAPIDPGVEDPADRSAAACAECHPVQTAEWEESRHRAAWTNGIFQREFIREPLNWCVRCHAPLATGGADSVDMVAAEGVGCAVCHLREGRMLAASKRADSPHETVEVEGFGSAAFCEGCHEFAFPVVVEGQVRAYTDHPMQATVSEFRAGALSQRAGECYGCHGDTPGGHRFPGGHDPSAVAHAAEVSLCRSGKDTLRVQITNAGAGHHLPTGDLHRHFRLRAWRSTAPVSMFEAFIGRAFEPASDAGKIVRVDTSIRPLETREWTVSPRALGGAPGEAVNVELRYVYTADEEPTERNDPGEPVHIVVWSTRVMPTEVERCGSR